MREQQDMIGTEQMLGLATGLKQACTTKPFTYVGKLTNAPEVNGMECKDFPFLSGQYEILSSASFQRFPRMVYYQFSQPLCSLWRPPLRDRIQPSFHR